MLPRLSGVSAGSFSATFDSSVAQATALSHADATTAPPSNIVGITPTSYIEAREIGDSLRTGSPVLLDLNRLSGADAKRLVDFEFGESSQDVEEHLPHGVSWVIDLPTEREREDTLHQICHSCVAAIELCVYPAE